MKKRKRRKVKRRWRTSRLTVDRHAYYVNQCTTVNDLIHQSEINHFSHLVADHQSDPKKLFATVDKFLHLSGEIKIAPYCDNSQVLVEKFADFSTEKISKIRAGLDSGMSQLNDWHLSTHNVSKVSCSNLSKYRPVSYNVLSSIIFSTMSKSCDLDLLPASASNGTVDILIPVITKIVDLSLDQALFPHVLKEAVVKPLLKPPSLDPEQFPNYRPVSNLTFISKLCERVLTVQLTNYLTDNSLMEQFQSAYKPTHSTESAF